jgi:hypothetical protein
LFGTIEVALNGSGVGRGGCCADLMSCDTESKLGELWPVFIQVFGRFLFLLDLEIPREKPLESS